MSSAAHLSPHYANTSFRSTLINQNSFTIHTTALYSTHHSTPAIGYAALSIRMRARNSAHSFYTPFVIIITDDLIINNFQNEK
jgi:NADH dehydrogenase FAD-containing subunit